VPFGAFVQVGEGIAGLVHISEMSAHHVDLPEQVVTPGEELWVKIIDLDLQRRRISLSIKQAAEGGIVAAEYQDAFGEHAYDDQGNYIGPEIEHSEDVEAAWADLYEAPEGGAPAAEAPDEGAASTGAAPEDAPAPEAAPEATPAPEAAPAPEAPTEAEAEAEPEADPDQQA
jgi:small subunit ribosomal protein S1